MFKPERGPLMGERAIAVRKAYRQAGAEVERTCKELPTHIGVELAFMGFLCEMEGAAVRDKQGDAFLDQEKGTATDSIEYRELQKRFLQEHLNEWFPQLSRSIQANAKSPLYRGLALITEAFLAWDTADLLTQSYSEKHMRAQRTSTSPHRG
jgi:TorA maturation chaperone TorD